MSRVTPEKYELRSCLALLENSPKVAWAHRMNTGAMVNEERFVKFGFPGLSDIIGQLKDGRLLAFEVKRKGGKLTTNQEIFLMMVERHNGVSGWGTIDHLIDLLKKC